MAMIDDLPDEQARLSVRRAGLELLTADLTAEPLRPHDVAALLILAATAIRSNPSKAERAAGFIGLSAVIAEHPDRDEIAHIIKDIS